MSDINTPEDLLRAAKVAPITIANCAECRHSQLDHTFKQTLVRICNAYGGKSCIIVNAKGDCQKFQEAPLDLALATALAAEHKDNPPQPPDVKWYEVIDPVTIVAGAVMVVGVIGFFTLLIVMTINGVP